MNLRILFLGLGWLFVIILVFFSKNEVSHTYYFDVIPSKAIMHGLLFWGFSHIWIAGLKKQLKYEFLKRNTFKIVFGSSIILAFSLELLVVELNYVPHFNYWSLIFDVLGTCGGIMSFRLLYAQCY